MNKVNLFSRRVIKAVSITALFIAAWWLRDVFMLAFGGLILATALLSAVARIVRIVPISEKVALAVVVVGIVALLSVLSWLIGGRVAIQFEELRTTLPRALDTAREWLNSSAVGLTLLDLYDAAKEGGVPWSRVATFTTVALGGIANAVLMVVLGLYLAASPLMYYEGLLRLVPTDLRKRVGAALIAAGTGLKQWLFGQMLSMIAIGTLTALGLYLLDMPLALSVGLIAGLLAFVPFFGPIVSGILAVVLAFTQGPQQAMYVAILCVGIQQIEGFVLMPLIQRWTVALPPALGLLSVVIFGLLFGLMGVVLATPLMVVLMILVQQLYVDDDESLTDP